MTKYLPKDYNLKFPKSSGEYTIIKAIGRGASTIAYLTTYTDETISHSERIVKEYYPCNLKIKRCEDGSLICDEKDKQQFKRGKEQFFAGGNRQNELRNKTNLKNEIPPLQGIYEANNTLYLEVTPFEGKTFDRIDNLSLLQKMKICLAVAKLVRQYHNLGNLCLDIKPENIFVLTNSSSEFVTDMIEFIDFDSVRSKKELTFGNSLSFTESWSAPEQKNPYGYSKISEATDIYTVGELVFWSVFGRHSNSDEHRGFSSYPFEDTELLFFKELTRKQLRILLTQLFRNTLRSSVRNRFTRMNEVIALIEKSVEELEKQEKINNSEIRLKDCFVGREKELEEIDQALKKNDIVFVSGIAGIGKSELVKQYICHHKNEFDNILYWIYEGNLETMVCNETSVSIANFSRLPKENDTAYCKRKLEEIKTLLTGDNLIVIDNVEDVLVEEFQHQEVWQGIQAIRGKILVSTRCNEKNYKQVEIHEIKNIESVKEIFYRHCPSARNIPEQTLFVEDIISIANYHTYEIELLAAYTEAKMQSPKDTLCEMKAFGFDKTEFSVLKDGRSPSATYREHLTKLFSMAQMSELQKKLMIKISCLPVTGICAKEFFFYYSIENKNDLNWLINHGFVNVTSDTEHILSVHPSISNVIIEIIKNDDQLLEDFLEDSFIAMRKGYDDESINQGYFEAICQSINDVTIKGKLDSDVESAKDSVRKEYELKYSKSQVSQTEYLQMCDSIVDKVTAHGVCCIAAAKFITQYVEWFAKYGRNIRNRNLIEYAIEVYDKKGTYQYMPDREYAYAVYAEILLNSKKYSETVDLCEKHLMLARKAKDWSMASYWSIDLAQAYFEVREISGSLFQVKSYYYMFRRAIQRNSIQNCWGNTFSRSMNNIACAWLK